MFKKKRIAEPQFAHAIKSLCDDAAALASDDPVRALEVLLVLIQDIKEVVYYRPIEKRPSQPRITKSAPNKWIEGRQKKIKEFNKNNMKAAKNSKEKLNMEK